jgi:hypothetical protein
MESTSRGDRVTLLADLNEFLHDHRPHGSMTGDASEPGWNGYLLTVACPCGVTFEPWVTAEDAELDLLDLARWN